MQVRLAVLSSLFLITTNSQGTIQQQLVLDPNHHQQHQQELSAFDRPPGTYLGWSSWSLQAYRGEGYGFYWLTERNVKAQADILSKEFSPFGYDRINLDSGWQDAELDQYGRTILNTRTFPSGIHHLQSYLARRNLKLGLYYLPGIDSRAVENQHPVMNTEYTADQIIQCPVIHHPLDSKRRTKCHRPMANAFNAGYSLNYSHPGSQMYINSVVDGLYSWNVSFVKLDALVPGSSFDPEDYPKCDTRADLAAWRRAIDSRYEEEWQYAGRERIWLVASWAIPTIEGPTMDLNADSWRVEQDIEAYGERMTTFDRVIRNIKTAALWTSVEENRAWRGLIDLDSLLVSDMTYEESQSTVTLWAVLGSPFYLGDDLTRLPESRKALVQNAEVLEVARLASWNPARLERFNQTRLEESRTMWQGDRNQVNIEECERLVEKRRMVVELSLHQKVDPVHDLRQCLKTQINQSRSLPINPPRAYSRPDTQENSEWSLQFWVLEHHDGVLFLAIVNAGGQNPFDMPVEVEIQLSELEKFQGTLQSMRKNDNGQQGEERWYLVRDLWRRETLGVVSFQGKIKLRLAVHASVLFKFAPIGSDHSQYPLMSDDSL
ncbi:hypothetical protein PTTG_12051 [Puccinia triticina 1-1 BBBD Race 1]|uniref:alpha-galactosidase n=2 Tax=Puccinia triticina TaxID=208348 RepID=A0A180GUH2_PUCT1|nr:uncharacterized protein PtA15_7A709 [Puccinia triticina]OAV96201.1 hypothetical protein PTTG_12051 [Puccinia triticina 1-1 BBBD Race 1]WAQ86980.1 hypothetical protein PtA15_7A709 [Puccinia triticina]WAR56841.1 hypothetical protein PtB15_7B692 [Puccinia triticina]